MYECLYVRAFTGCEHSLDCREKVWHVFATG
jgi:hypothetical protein